MSKPNEERDIYYIPPNFLASGRLFGGMIRARNAIEACVLVLLTGIPIIKLPMSLTVRITVSNGYQIINRADVGGQYLNEWQTAKTTWVTTVRRFNTTPLPKTGY